MAPLSFLNDLPPSESNEALREALLSLQQEYEGLKRNRVHVEQLLDALESLLVVREGEDPFTSVFSSLRKIFQFTHVFMLAEPEHAGEGGDFNELECIVSELPQLLGTRWQAGSLFRKVMNGKVVATFSGAGVAEWAQAARLGLGGDWSVLHVPVRVRERRGILLLMRGPDMEGFDRAQIALAHRYSVLVSHALATRYASQDAAESRRLRELGEQLRRSEETSRRNADLLENIVQAMPVGVVVRNTRGRLQMINDAAAAAFGSGAENLAEGESGLSLPGTDDGEAARLFSATRERHVMLDGAEHTLLVTTTPVRIFDDRLLLTTSLDITERKRFEEQLRHRAFHDQLTGLPNRSAMENAVTRAITARREQGMFALAFIDLDNFKQVNDYYSHALGDQLLLAVTGRICSVIRKHDVLARISGDEFLLLIDGIASASEVQPVIDRIVDAIRQPFLLEGHELFTSASIGVSVFPLHGSDYETLRRSADNAMYHAKNQHKGSATWFDASMSASLTARMDIEQRLRSAIRDSRFRTAYQPKVRIDDATITGFEALVRWIDTDGSLHMPGEFIAIANELGLIDDITFFVLGHIAADLPEILARHGSEITVSINIAARQASDKAFMSRFIEHVGRYGIAKHLLVELTEEALLAASSFQNEVLPHLRALGLRVSIDDFGTGYSSLSTLADITTDELKVDRAFITRIHERSRSQGILKAIESVCTVLGISIVAEGVESREELDYLRNHTSIRLAQGYYFGKPEFLDRIL